MKQQLALIGLGPLLLVQGLYARYTTPRLPEPAGQRDGVDGQGRPLRLLIVGDSAAAGVGVDSQHMALTGRLVAELATDFQVQWKMIARTGHTAQQVIDMLQQHGHQTFDVVVTSVGVNDVTANTKPAVWSDLQRQLIDLLQSRFGAKHILLSAVPPMHAFPALPQPLRWFLGQKAKRLNNELAILTHQHPHCQIVAADFPLEPAFMAADGFHPGAPAYAVWAGAVAQAIRLRLNNVVQTDYHHLSTQT